jgi:spore coat polysaccharide biosynthesis predicted glycosyltransferase SpsG
MGHLARALALAEALEQSGVRSISFFIIGDQLDHPTLSGYRCDWGSATTVDWARFGASVRAHGFRTLVFDLHPAMITCSLLNFISRIRTDGVRCVGVDALALHPELLDLAVIPSPHNVASPDGEELTNLLHGWPFLLLNVGPRNEQWSPAGPLLVLTGASDTAGLALDLPHMLDTCLPIGTRVRWVQGPYAAPPNLHDCHRLEWTVVSGEIGLQAEMSLASYALSVYGVTLFELMYFGVPTVLFSPYGQRDVNLLPEVEQWESALVGMNQMDAVLTTGCLIGDPVLAARLSTRSMDLVDGQGARRIAEAIVGLVGAA